MDELKKYLNMPAISTKALKPLMWWYAISESNPLMQMAINFLSAPGKLLILSCCVILDMNCNSHLASSWDVKSGFSHSGLTVSKLWHGLSDKSTCTSTVLHAWSEIPGLILKNEIIQVFKDKCHRLKTGKDKDSDILVVESDSDGSDVE